MLITTHNIFQKMFQRWANENNIQNKYINKTHYEKRDLIFLTLDAYKTASRDDYYKEKNYSQKLNIEDIEDFIEPIWMEEIGLEGIVELNMNENDIYEESKSLFNRSFTLFVKYREEDIYDLER